MAGAGGLFVMLIGALVGILAAALAVAFLLVWPSALGPRVSRALAFVVAGASLVAVVLMLPLWFVVVSGRGTHGEAWDYTDPGLWF